MAKLQERVSMSLLSIRVVIGYSLELSLVSFSCFILGSELCVLSFKLSISDFLSVKLGLEIIDSIVRLLEVSKDVLILALHINDKLVELITFILQILSGFQKSLS